ncbi:MAG: hypothetical protein Q9163_002477 [Psora crenata]
MAAALTSPSSNDKRRVKVYELKNNDWFDRGTGFCTGQTTDVGAASEESRIYVHSEDEPDRILLDTKIGKEDRYQKQKQQDDALSDDAMDSFASNPLVLPQPEIGSLEDIEHAMRSVASTPQGRDALAKFVLNEDYIRKLVPLVEMAEDLESLRDLHMLCNIMKMLILLNDSQIVDHIVNEDVVFGVIGALEYDPDFPTHKANHRRYLKDHSRYKEVVKIADPAITSKIHATWRLTYLKDVVLARILDDPTFGVLNSLIFFNQVDIITHLQSNPSYLEELFGMIDSPTVHLKRKKDAVSFIQSCCAIAKSLQAPARANLYTIFINHGLLQIITFAILNKEASLRVAGTDILVAMIDHDPGMVRAYILKSIAEKKTPLTDTLIELLLVESDLGVKAQAADAIKVLLEPATQSPQPQAQAAAQAQAQDSTPRGGEYLSKLRVPGVSNPQVESYIIHFYEHSAKKLFKPLRDLEGKPNLNGLTFNDVQLFNHLIEIIVYLTRTHHTRSRYYLFSENLVSRIAQLLSSPHKHLKLTALKFFRSCIGLMDEAYSTHFIQHDHFTPILNIVYDTMPRDNLLNSACLDLFETIRQQGVKPLMEHLVLVHRSRLQEITYVDTFQNLLHRWEQMNQAPPAVEQDMTLFSNDGEGARTPERRRNNVNGNRWQGMKEMDAAEQAYFDTSDDEEEDDLPSLVTKQMKTSSAPRTNGLAPSPILKSLVDYPDDDEDVLETLPTHSPEKATGQQHPKLSPSPMLQTPPPERLSEKRRRQDDEDEDELGKLSTTSKRRNAAPSASTPGGNTPPGNNPLRKKKGFFPTKDKDRDAASAGAVAEPRKKIAISIGPTTKAPPVAASEPGGKQDDGGGG